MNQLFFQLPYHGSFAWDGSAQMSNFFIEFRVVMRVRLFFNLLLFGLALSTCCRAVQSPVPPANPPQVAEASREASDALLGFKYPDGWQPSLFAAEPHTANIVAFTLDRQGRAYVCETFRQNAGVTDNRGHDEQWLRADLAAMTVADRIDYHRRLLGEQGVQQYQAQDDRLRLVEDTDGDGLADRAVVFADGFNRLEEGTGAGVLDYRGSVYYTCIPKLWRLFDRDQDGKADERIALHDGFGVRVAFRGHDMHGLILGPDGRLYFSIGDRGYHVALPDGTTLQDPSSGAVFRCEIDGSNLQVFATGLRNPQELAFDQFGNLFTGDNNSDGGDRARWVYVVEGGDTGWRMEYQYIPDRGPFNREKLWHPFHQGQPAYIIPPVDNVADGPSGLIYYPGTGLGDQLNDTFLLADFRGTANQSGIRAIKVEPKGAHFKLASNEQLVWQILATDLAMGSDGNLYISDWVDGWDGTGKGRIYRFESNQADAVEKETVKSLLQGNWASLSNDSLAKLLGHRDQRIRYEAQFELVSRQDHLVLSSVAGNQTQDDLLARLHALWGLGQLARLQSQHREICLLDVAKLLNDSQPHIRAAACGIVGDLQYQVAADKVTLLVGDIHPRVAHFAAMACAKLKTPQAFNPALELLERAENHDPVLRHAATKVLANCAANDHQIVKLSQHPHFAIRLGAVVALRHRATSAIEAFLLDQHPQVVDEAIRAIHDLPIANSLAAVASRLPELPRDQYESQFRALNANYRLGLAEHAKRVADLAADSQAPEKLRLEAIFMLGQWAKPDERDRYLNAWRPIPERSDQVARTEFGRVAFKLLGDSEALQGAAIDLVSQYMLKELVQPITVLIQPTSNSSIRAKALKAISKLEPDRIKTLIDSLLNDSDWQVTLAALEILIDIDPQRAAGALAKALNNTDLSARQAAWRLAARLGDQPEVVKLMQDAVQRYIAGDLDPGEWLDVLHASRGKIDQSLKTLLEEQQQLWQNDDTLAPWRWALAGGDVQRGRNIFFYKTEVSCLRCHKVGNQGGEVGPALTDLGAKKDARYLLEAITLPNAKIAEGFESVTMLDDAGTLHTGVLKRETDSMVEYMTAEGKVVQVEKESIEERRSGNSAMPLDLIKFLSDDELRDLVAYLQSLKGGKAEGH